MEQHSQSNFNILYEKPTKLLNIGTKRRSLPTDFPTYKRVYSKVNYRAGLILSNLVRGLADRRLGLIGGLDS
jgi:hypothetical protein